MVQFLFLSPFTQKFHNANHWPLKLNKIGGHELGTPRKEETYFSPVEGVPILEGVGNPREMIREMEKVLEISSCIDNI